MFFFAPGTVVDPPLAPAVRRPGCPPTEPSDHWHGGLGGSLGDFEAWEPQRLGAVPLTYRGARGQQRALGHGAIKAQVECSNHFPSFGRYDWVLGPFWAKKRLFWGTKCVVLGGHLPTPPPPPPGRHPPSFCLKTWIWQGHRLGSRMARVE